MLCGPHHDVRCQKMGWKRADKNETGSMKLWARALQPRSLMSLASRTHNCLMMRCGLGIIWHSGQGAFGPGHMHQGPYRDQKISLFPLTHHSSVFVSYVLWFHLSLCGLSEGKQKIFVSKRSHYLLYLINQERVCVSEMSSIKPWTFLLS